MCAVSMVTDDWTRKHFPNIIPWTPSGPMIPIHPEEFYKLKKEIEDLKEELKKARAKDIEEDAGQCDMKDGVQLIRDLAKRLGVDLEDVFDGHEES